MTRDEVLKVIEQAAAEGWTALDLSDNRLIEIPEEIAQLINLTTLDLSSNKITEIPEVIAQLTNLTELHLSRNQISEIPEAIAKLQNLTQLYLDNNQIAEIPEAITQLINIKELYLDHNQIKRIPEKITQLSNLTTLYLWDNRISVVPEAITKLKKLTTLHLGSNQIKEISAAITTLSGLTKLYLWGNQITVISEAIAKLSNLIKLYLNSNQITEIPEEITKLSNLTELYLWGNQITVIPRSISQLSNLTQLDLKGNQIKEIPEEIGQLANLSSLDLSSNQIKEIPEEITQLANLTELKLHKNKIREIPQKIKQLSQLKVFYISHNKINKIPIEIGQMYTLKEFSIFDNLVTEIPEVFKDLPNLEKLDLRKNPLPISPEVLGSEEYWGEPGSVADIFNYLRQLKSGEVRPLNEAKLILVGQGSVGKTSLIQRLINDAYNPNEPQTDGLNVENWEIHVNSKDIRLNVWDFGGQEIYHATHQFFLTKRSLYLLVCNCRTSEEENRIEYWLKLIQTFGDASPVIIVGNKKDEQPFDINRKALREKYPNIQAIIETSCQSGDGIEDLRKAIYAQVANLKEVYDLLPLSWFEVKEQLEAMTEDFITYNRYLGICYEHKIPEEKNQEQLIDLLHRLGLVLNFREHPLLQQTNVLKPDWATEGIYTLLSDETLKTENKGIFTITDLSRILDPERYPTDKHCYLIELMKEFELCFALDCQPIKYLIPGILPKDEPNETNLGGDTLEFQYHYRVLPESIISRFIVKTHEKIHKQIWWRSGVMLEYKEGTEICNIARIKADPEDKKIFITINGKPETRRLFLGIIRDVFNKIHSTFANPEITEWVPVPDHPEHVLQYSDLLGLEEMGETHKIIGELKLRLDLRQLLDGYESREQRQQARNDSSRIEYHFHKDVHKPDFTGVKTMTDKQPNISINAENIGIASMSGGMIESGAIVAGQYNEASNDLEDLLQLLALMKEAVQFFPQEQQEDITIDLDDIEAEIKKPKDQRKLPKIKKCLTALATAGTMAIATLGAANTATVQLNTFVDNASTLANKFQIELPVNAATQNPN